jgi:hypothetical protein
MSVSVSTATQHYLDAVEGYNRSLVETREIEGRWENLAANLSLVTAPESDDGWERLAALYEMDRALAALKAAVEEDNHSTAEF